MKTINKYIIQNFFAHFLVYFGIITSLFLLNYVYQLIRPILTHKTSLFIVVKLFIYLLPSIISLAVPVTVLLAIILTFAIMNETNEITILQTMGVKQSNYTSNLIVLSFIVTFIMIYFNGYTVPHNYKYFKDLYTNYVLSSPSIKFNDNTFITFGNKKIYVQKVNENNLSNVYIYNPDDETNLQVISAKSAVVESDLNDNLVFNLYNGRLNIIDKKNVSESTQLCFKKYVYIIYSEQINTLISASKTFREMDNNELFIELKNITTENPGYKLILTEYFLRYTLSISVLIFVLFGITLSHRLKKNAKPLSFVSTILVIGTYYFILLGCLTVSEHLKDTKSIFYLIAFIMQLPNIIFFIIYVLLSKIYK